MNILYLHGLNSSLSPEKRKVLELYGKVLAPRLDYETNPNSINTLIQEFTNKAINVVIGSSMGGFAAYYISNAFQRPVLLFNPALVDRSMPQNIPEIKSKTSFFKQIVLGTHDTIVNPKLTLNFLAETLKVNSEYKVHIHNDLAHRIPIDVFEEEVKLFFNQMCY
jgi:hypothetical protein